jgi:hypothetical protein
MFLVSGLLEFLYEIELKPVQKSVKTIRTPIVPVPGGITDYYFLLDNSESMGWNDPSKERIKLLKSIID